MSAETPSIRVEVGCYVTPWLPSEKIGDVKRALSNAHYVQTTLTVPYEKNWVGREVTVVCGRCKKDVHLLVTGPGPNRLASRFLDSCAGLTFILLGGVLLFLGFSRGEFKPVLFAVACILGGAIWILVAFYKSRADTVSYKVAPRTENHELLSKLVKVKRPGVS
jgi:hypothetical protein